MMVDFISETDLRRLRGDSSIPLVTRGDVKGARVGRVVGDVDAIARMAVDYFQERGFRSMACIDQRSWEFDPCHHFVRLARSRKHRVVSLHFAPNEQDDYDHGRALARVRQFLGDLEKPSAIFLGGLHCANLVYRACHSLRIQIPQQLAILTNDDDPVVCSGFTPHLSGVTGESSHIGLAMARMLEGMMDGTEPTPGPLPIPPEKIVTRQSTDILSVSHPATAQAISYIFANYSRMIGVAEISRHIGLSPNTLQRSFREHLGKMPNEFLRDTRMRRAKELLEESELSLREIAPQIGYSCSMTFYSAFKRIFEITPGEYRRRYRVSAARGKRAATLAK